MSVPNVAHLDPQRGGVRARHISLHPADTQPCSRAPERRTTDTGDGAVALRGRLCVGRPDNDLRKVLGSPEDHFSI
jgi:hypothetical protein